MRSRFVLAALVVVFVVFLMKKKVLLGPMAAAKLKYENFTRNVLKEMISQRDEYMSNPTAALLDTDIRELASTEGREMQQEIYDEFGILALPPAGENDIDTMTKEDVDKLKFTWVDCPTGPTDDFISCLQSLQ